MYANMQGIEECRSKLMNKSIMKKGDKRIKPIFYENMSVNNVEVNDILTKYTYDA